MIGIISDSHLPTRAEEIPEEFLEILDRADKVVHCGDFEYPEVYERLDDRYPDFTGVMGNCDRIELPKYEKFEYEGFDCGVTHGTGISPRGHIPTLANIADKMDVKVLFHGHTHQQEAVEHERRILLNPGSCTGVGGGSSNDGNPKMMTVEVGHDLKVQMITLDNGQIRSETKNFEVPL